ncbi:MAG TPA: hypothetical protein PKG52_02140 [bacterium]|nr:hypothetical protein [bacterium]HPS28671.1 hypothetical protein [bacterium]
MIKYLSILSICFLIFACSSAGKKSEKLNVGGETKSSEPELTAKGGKLNFDPKLFLIKKYDINKDKQPDIINVFKKIHSENGKSGEVVLQIYVKMMDLNRDTKIDVWRYFDETGAVSKEEIDLDFDGKIDVTDYYVNGIVRKKELDFQFDEKTDTWKTYDEKGILVLIEVDQSGDGTPDYWEFYSNGVLERIEKDTDGDGKADIFKRSQDKGFTKILSTTEKFEDGSVKEPTE